MFGVEGKAKLAQVLCLIAVPSDGDVARMLLGWRVDQGLAIPEPDRLAGHLSVFMTGDEDDRVGRLVGHVFQGALVDEALATPVTVLGRGGLVAGLVADFGVVVLGR